jgi:hypothetical protein
MTKEQKIQILNESGYKAEEGIMSGGLMVYHLNRNQKATVADWSGTLKIQTVSSHWTLEEAKQYAVELQEAIAILEQIQEVN